MDAAEHGIDRLGIIAGWRRDTQLWQMGPLESPEGNRWIIGIQSITDPDRIATITETNRLTAALPPNVLIIANLPEGPYFEPIWSDSALSDAEVDQVLERPRDADGAWLTRFDRQRIRLGAP